MGYSADWMPHVGPVPNKPNQYIIAGFTGHGMPQVFHAARHVAELVLLAACADGGSPDPDRAVPLPYRLSPDRWGAAAAPEHASLALWRSVMEDNRVRGRL